ncbi:hypothetical protein B738_06789 [Photorhabdus temperata subsp. temperata M1021]|nr:hypothetical protein B738_06789 [Photorhabdus temperata subsp. temperata M1021]
MVGGYSNHIVIIVEEGGAFIILHLPVMLILTSTTAVDTRKLLFLDAHNSEKPHELSFSMSVFSVEKK